MTVFSYHRKYGMLFVYMFFFFCLSLIAFDYHYRILKEKDNTIVIGVICLVLAMAFAIYGFAWSRAGAYLSGDEMTIQLRLSPFLSARTVSWKSIKKIEYSLSRYSKDKSLNRSLILFLEDGEEIEVPLNHINIDINDFQPLVTALAPHIEWIWPNRVKGILDI